MKNSIPKLITLGVIAERLGVPLHRIRHVLATRPHIKPTAVAGNLRLFDSQAVAQVRYEITLSDARRAEKGSDAHAP